VRSTRRGFLEAAGATLAGLAATPFVLGLADTRLSAQAIAGAATYTGDATTTSLGPSPLNAGVTVVRAQFNGTGDFAANLIQPQPGQGPTGLPVTGGYFALFNQLGTFSGGAIALIGVPGQYYLQTSSSGAFRLSVEQPTPETVAPVQQTSFSGKGITVSPYFTLPGSVSQISMQTTSKMQVAALYHIDDLGGSAISAGLRGQYSSIFDFRDPGNQPSFPISLPDGGPYILAVLNDVQDQDAWTINFA